MLNQKTPDQVMEDYAVTARYQSHDLRKHYESCGSTEGAAVYYLAAQVNLLTQAISTAASLLLKNGGKS